MARWTAFFLGFGWLVGAFFCQMPSSPQLTIATAANMQFAMEALVQSFTQQTGIPCEVVISSSGKLTAQIREGAPYDVFVSADAKYPADLFESGYIAQAPQIYARGKLILWTMDSTLELSDLKVLFDPSIRHIAIANPHTAPYGTAAQSVITHLTKDDRLSSKLVYGESIAQVNQFIHTQAAEVGFTALSAMYAPHIRGQGKWIVVPDSLYPPIEQAAVILRPPAAKVDAARAFYAFLFSEKGKTILRQYGYSM